MNLILHIGPYKTGTSAIQQTFKSYSDLLLSKGVYYPIPQTGGKNLNLIASLLYHNKTELSNLLFNIKSKAENLNCHTTFISAETLWNIKTMYDWHNKKNNIRSETQILTSFKNDLNKYFSSIEIIYFERNITELNNSLFNQLIKDVTDFSSTFLSFKKNFKYFFNYGITINIWKSIFINSDFHKYKYSSDVIKTVFDHLNIELHDYELKSNIKLDNNLLFIKWLSNSEMSSHSYRVFKWKKFIKISSDIDCLNRDFNSLMTNAINKTISVKLIFFVIAKYLHKKIQIKKLKK